MNQIKYIRNFVPIQFTQSTTVSNTSKYSEDDITAAYRTYSRCPYINETLRNNRPLSESDKKLIDCLKQAINTSEPIKGTFVRGLTFNKNLPLNEENIKKYLFNNQGFTSTCPKENEYFAKTFAIGKNSAVVEIEITKPVHAYKASNYEVLFDTDFFNADNFKLIKINENRYKLVQK